ncbi:hypothetical protein AAY473_040375 [Plecturocebus cupreus]
MDRAAVQTNPRALQTQRRKTLAPLTEVAQRSAPHPDAAKALRDEDGDERGRGRPAAAHGDGLPEPRAAEALQPNPAWCLRPRSGSWNTQKTRPQARRFQTTLPRGRGAAAASSADQEAGDELAETPEDPEEKGGSG